MISDNFKMNSGDAMISIASFANISKIDMSIQEGKYIDDRIQITLANVDSVATLFLVNNTQSEEIIYIDSAPALYQVFSDLQLVKEKCKTLVSNS